MSRGARTFKQRDVTAAINGARAAGYEVQGIEVRQDGFKIIVASGHTTAGPTDDLEPLRKREIVL
jgi:hypothetical protein